MTPTYHVPGALKTATMVYCFCRGQMDVESQVNSQKLEVKLRGPLRDHALSNHVPSFVANTDSSRSRI